jgi:hypothetical protein
MSTGTVVAGMREDDEIEREIKAKGLTAPRVTPQRIEEVITGEYYFTAYEGVSAADGGTQFVKLEQVDALSLLTFCVLVLKNGFTVYGSSACASPENFNAELGRKIARAKALEGIWPLEGYLLKQRLDDEIERQRQLNSDGGI